jgi:two-component system, OmpR family, sensor histidine kinase KdpD
VYVRTPQESAVRIDATVQRRIADTLETAQKMGGLVISLKHDNVPQALVSFAKEYGITHVVLGRPKPKRLHWVGLSMHEILMRELPDVDLVIV